MGVTPCPWRSALSPTLFNYEIDWILGEALQYYPGVHVGANVHVSNIAYADEVVKISSSYSEMQGRLEIVNRHAATVGMCIKTSKTTVKSAIISGEQIQAVLLDSESVEDVDKCSSQTARAPRRSEAGLILLVLHSLVWNPVLV